MQNYGIKYNVKVIRYKVKLHLRICTANRWFHYIQYLNGMSSNSSLSSLSKAAVCVKISVSYINVNLLSMLLNSILLFAK